MLESRSRRIAWPRPALAGWLAVLIVTAAGPPARAQDARTDSGASGRSADAGRRDGGKDRGRRQGGAKVGAKAGAKEKGRAARVEAPRREPSRGFQEEIRKTVEQRRQRRARRAQAMGGDGARPPGAIVPWPMPPALIIRHTPEVHDEVESLLGQLRRGG